MILVGALYQWMRLAVSAQKPFGSLIERSYISLYLASSMKARCLPFRRNIVDFLRHFCLQAARGPAWRSRAQVVPSEPPLCEAAGRATSRGMFDFGRRLVARPASKGAIVCREGSFRMSPWAPMIPPGGRHAMPRLMSRLSVSSSRHSSSCCERGGGAALSLAADQTAGRISARRGDRRDRAHDRTAALGAPRPERGLTIGRARTAISPPRSRPGRAPTAIP